jgi:putative GTP pyrophosphokinase
MTGSEKHEKPKAGVDRILAEFDAREDMLAAFCARTKSLIEASLQDANVQYQSVQVRVKTRKKLREKYLDSTKNYERLDDITDLAGLRVITYYEDDVDRVAEAIKREFDIDSANSLDKRDTEPDRFGYNALNYVCKHLEKRTSDVEYKKFAGVRCEIQITSILRHAWAEIEHEWYDLKDAYPETVKRRFYLLAALLELAESEFRDIRKSRTQYERSVAVRVEAQVPDLLVDAVSMRSFIEQEPLVAEIDKSIAAILGRDLLEAISDYSVEQISLAANAGGMTKVQTIRHLLKEYRGAIPEYLRQCQQEIWRPTPAGSRLVRGICVLHLSLLLANLQGPKETAELLKAIQFPYTIDIAKQVSIAKEVVAKHSS